MKVILMPQGTSLTSSTLNILPMTSMMKLDGTDYQNWKKTLVMNMTFYKIGFGLGDKSTRDSD